MIFYSTLIIDNHATVSIFILKAVDVRSQCSKKSKKNVANFPGLEGVREIVFFHIKLNIICCFFIRSQNETISAITNVQM